MSNLYDIKCLDPRVAVKAIWILWRRSAWEALEEIGLPKTLIDGPFRQYSDRVIGYRLSYEKVTEFLFWLDDDVATAVESSASLLNTTYMALYRKEILTDVYLSHGSGPNRRSRKRSRQNV